MKPINLAWIRANCSGQSGGQRRPVRGLRATWFQEVDPAAGQRMGQHVFDLGRGGQQLLVLQPLHEVEQAPPTADPVEKGDRRLVGRGLHLSG